MAKAITFGEIMMRLNPEGYLRFTQSTSFEATYAGGEANVPIPLSSPPPIASTWWTVSAAATVLAVV